MTARYATEEEITRWDSLILQNPDGGNVFSSFEYAEIKKLTGYTPRYIVVDSTTMEHAESVKSARLVAVTVLEKQTPPLGKLWYLPKGPNINAIENTEGLTKNLKKNQIESSSDNLFAILEAIQPLAKKARVFAIRIEPELPQKIHPLLEDYGLKKAIPIIPNPSTITLSLNGSIDEIMATLPQKGRHAIRRAERDGVTIELSEANEENCKKMYALLAETAKGQFGIRSYNYYKTFWQTFEKAGLGQLFFAVYENKRVAGAYAMTFGKKSTYKDGASIRERTAYGASHLLQWKVIEWAYSRGVLVHDFCGSPPSSQIDNPEHPHYGIGRFKMSLSRHVVDYIGCYDFVLNPLSYLLWIKFGERIYRHFYFKKTHDYYY